MTGHRPNVPPHAALAEAPSPGAGNRVSVNGGPPQLMAPPSDVHERESLSFDAVYDAHFAFVWRSVRRLGVPESAIDDVVHDVFLVVHRRLADFEGRSSVRSWLFGIALHVVRDLRRTLRRKPALLGGASRADGEDMDSVVDSSALRQDDSVAKGEAVKLLHAVLDAMADERREVFILAELEQMSVTEIADAIGTNVNTMHSRLRAARADFERAIARIHAGDAWTSRARLGLDAAETRRTR